jgi:hypothetical protein
LSRDGDHAVLNGGRSVINEKAVIAAIRKLLKERNQGEKLMIFTTSTFKDISKTMQYFAQHVRAVIGPSGGAVYNQRWAGKDTLILEFMPSGYHFIGFWEEAMLLEQHYWVMMLQSKENNNMVVPIPRLINILRAHLGKPDSRGTVIRKPYNWDLEKASKPVKIQK